MAYNISTTVYVVLNGHEASLAPQLVNTGRGGARSGDREPRGSYPHSPSCQAAPASTAPRSGLVHGVHVRAEADIRVEGQTAAAVAAHAPALAAMLQPPEGVQPQLTPFGRLDPPLGLARVKVRRKHVGVGSICSLTAHSSVVVLSSARHARGKARQGQAVVKR